MTDFNVVIDTNVLVSALRSKQGASYKLLTALTDNLYVPNVSVPLFIEYESVLKRDGIVSGLTHNDIDDVLDYFLSCSSLRQIYFLWRPYLKDPKDDLVLEVAVESSSRFIVTYNQKDFKGSEKFGVKTVTPLEYLKHRGVII